MEERNGVIYVTAEEMRRMDDSTIRDYKVDVLVLMENAGKAVATIATRMLSPDAGRARIACLVGGGNNGGDGMVAARHLTNWDLDVDVIAGTSRDKIRDVPLAQLKILQRMDIPILFDQYSLGRYDLLVDGLIGYGLDGNPRDRTATIIRDANKSSRPVLSIDVPSGMNATTGEAYDPCIKAAATLTLGLPKMGFLKPKTQAFIGDLFVADIAIPRNLYHEFGQKNALFSKEPIIMISTR